MSERQLVVVDAANVVGSRPDGWWRDRAGAARRLVQSLASTVARAEPLDVVVVLEGQARPGAEPGRLHEIQVVHAPGSGDDAIVQLVASEVAAAAPRPVLVITSDRGLRARVDEYGARVAGPSWVWGRLDVADPPRET